MGWIRSDRRASLPRSLLGAGVFALAGAGLQATGICAGIALGNSVNLSEAGELVGVWVFLVSVGLVAWGAAAAAGFWPALWLCHWAGLRGAAALPALSAPAAAVFGMAVFDIRLDRLDGEAELLIVAILVAPVAALLGRLAAYGRALDPPPPPGDASPSRPSPEPP
ncbi:hypothetical protein ACQ5SO_19935 [Rhodovulum sp. DZ06]|uniref:hypothetical protein n=1 Tax=Rhodovulum sp. DZ06 TaxID=3425126 RepID=UPI003D346FE2